MPPETAVAPAVGETWQRLKDGREIVIQAISSRKVVFHDANKQLRSLTFDTLGKKYRRVFRPRFDCAQ